jgi:hypothetical protein
MNIDHLRNRPTTMSVTGTPVVQLTPYELDALLRRIDACDADRVDAYRRGWEEAESRYREFLALRTWAGDRTELEVFDLWNAGTPTSIGAIMRGET